MGVSSLCPQSPLFPRLQERGFHDQGQPVGKTGVVVDMHCPELSAGKRCPVQAQDIRSAVIVLRFCTVGGVNRAPSLGSECDKCLPRASNPLCRRAQVQLSGSLFEFVNHSLYCGSKQRRHRSRQQSRTELEVDLKCYLGPVEGESCEAPMIDQMAKWTVNERYVNSGWSHIFDAASVTCTEFSKTDRKIGIEAPLPP